MPYAAKYIKGLEKAVQKIIRPDVELPITKKKYPTRGFASMSLAKRRAIASIGGQVAAERGTAHRYTIEEAKIAGRKGGMIISQDREHMRAIGKLGGRKLKK